MSITYYVYSPNRQVVSRSQVADHLRSKGWTVMFVAPDDPMRFLPEGTITHDLLLAANSQEIADQVRELMGRGDKEALDDLYARNKAASCTVAATQPYDFNDDHSDSDAQELADAIGTEAVEAMRRAVSSYEIYTSAQRSRPSYQFQEDVWEVLGELAGGLMEDPQSGSYQIYENGSKREIEPASAPDIEPSDIRSLLTRFIDRARERGFPVSGQGGNAGVVTDELDLARMEELLKLASTCVPADPAFSLSEELLDEYVSNKGESFETQHGDWIEAMRNCRWSGGSTEGGPRPGPIGFLRRLFLRKGGQ